MKQFLKRLFKRTVVLPKTQSSMEVLIVDEDVEYLHEALGISEERCKELGKKITFCLQTYNSKLMAYKELSKICNHPNELAFAIQAFEASISANKNPFMRLFEEMRKK